VTGLLPRGPEFDSRPFHVGFVLKKVVSIQALFRHSDFPLSVSLYQSTYFPLSVSLYQSTYFPLSVSLYQSTYFPLSVSLYQSTYFPLSVSLYQSTYIQFYCRRRYTILAIHSFVKKSFCLSVFLSVMLSLS